MKIDGFVHKGFKFYLVVVFLMIILFCFGFARQAAAVNQIDTKYYTIVYEDECAFTAGEIAKFCDDIYEKLMARYHAFNSNPRVTCIVTDEADYANGYALYFQNTITIYATSMDFELRGQSNWLRNVFVHEMTHMIALQKAAKGPVNFVLLNAGKFNQNPDFDITLALYHLSQPLWFVEGSAQAGAESYGAERWDTHREMLLRSAWYENSLLSLDEMTVLSGKDGMNSEMVYNQGYSLVRFLKDKYGYDKVVKLNNTKNIMDFDPVMEKVLGAKPQKVYEDWRESLNSRYQPYKNHTFVEGEKIADEGSTDFYPAVSPDGRYLAWLSNRGRDYSITDLMLKDLTTGKKRILVKNIDQRFSWSHDSQKLLFVKRPAPGSRFYDIFTYDLGDNSEQRVSKNMRARDPEFSPGDSLIVFVRNEGGNNALAVIAADGTGLKFLTSTHDGTQFYAPSFSPDGSKILFGLFKQDLDRDIGLIDIGSKSYRYRWDIADSTKGFSDSTSFAKGTDFRILLSAKSDERDPRFLPDGRGIVYASDASGIFNIYTLDIESGKARRVTDVYGGAFCPSMGPAGELYYAGFKARDFSIYRLKIPESIEEISPLAEMRDYLVQPKPFDLQKNFSVEPFRNKRVVNAIVPTVMLGPSFIGSRFGLNVVNVGAQVYLSDLLGQDAFVLSGSLGKNLKEDVSLNNSLEFYYERKMAPVTSSRYTHSPSLFLGGSREVINNFIERLDAVADTFYVANIDSLGYKNVIHDLSQRYTVADVYRDEFRRYRTGIQVPLASRHFLSFELSLRQYFEALRRMETLQDMSTYIAGGKNITSQVPGAGATQTADTRLFSDMEYFRSVEMGISYFYARNYPAADNDISPKGTVALFQFKHMRSEYADSLLNQPTWYIPSGIGIDRNNNLAFSYSTYNPDKALDVLRPYKKSIDVNEYTLFFNGNYKLPRYRHAFDSLVLIGYRDIQLKDPFKGQGNGYDWPLKYYLGGEYTLSGYPYFAFWGSKVFLGRLSYVFPLRSEIGKNMVGMHIQRLYGSAFFEVGSVWNFRTMSMKRLKDVSFKRDIGFELRLKTVLFYRLDALAYFKVAWPLNDMGESPYQNDARRYYFGLRM
ncbi:MAG: hypothetical protein Q8O92_11315 [Candidatus Latescibacter sp.]|nr:hypothetical protein [Candidatus Latescibacter sp.]